MRVRVNAAPAKWLPRAAAASLLAMCCAPRLGAAGDSAAAHGAGPQGMNWAALAQLPDFYTGVWDPIVGHSIGHWEHGTLLIDTVGIKSPTDPDGEHSPHVIERLRLRAPDLLTVEMTIVQDGSRTLTQRQYRRQTDWTIREYYCEENARDILDARGQPAVIGVSR